MALRTSTLPASAPAPLTPADWRQRVQDSVAAGAAALACADMTALAAVYTDLATWADRQRAHQALCDLTEIVLGHRPQRVDGWVPGFVTAADRLLECLQRDPAEPTILNLAGVLLYELLELGAAETLFRAVRRLDPGHPQAAANLAQTRLRKRAGGATLAGPYGVKVRRMGAAAKRVSMAAQPARGLTLSLCMIVKDEEEMLPGCLAPLAGVVDEMIVVDTGSSDRTVQIAESFGARVVSFPWNGSFADARNASIEAASGDWIMYLDADEHMEAEDAGQLRELAGRTWREGFYLVETNYTGGDDVGSATTHMALRMWRNRPGYRFEGRIHEQKTHTMPMYLTDRFEHTTIRVRHYGYLNQRIRAREKSQRNIQLLEQEARENPSPFNDYNLARSLAIWSCRSCSAIMPEAAM
jgi:Glycosyl transferase family 2